MTKRSSKSPENTSRVGDRIKSRSKERWQKDPYYSDAATVLSAPTTADKATVLSAPLSARSRPPYSVRLKPRGHRSQCALANVVSAPLIARPPYSVRLRLRVE